MNLFLFNRYLGCTNLLNQKLIMNIFDLCNCESDSLSDLANSYQSIIKEIDVLNDNEFYDSEKAIIEIIDELRLLLNRIPGNIKTLKAFKHSLLTSRQEQIKAHNSKKGK